MSIHFNYLNLKSCDFFEEEPIHVCDQSFFEEEPVHVCDQSFFEEDSCDSKKISTSDINDQDDPTFPNSNLNPLLQQDQESLHTCDQEVYDRLDEIVQKILTDQGTVSEYDQLKLNRSIQSDSFRDFKQLIDSKSNDQFNVQNLLETIININSFNILHGMLNNNMLDLDTNVNNQPLWLVYLKTISQKKIGKSKTQKEILKLITDHLEKIENFPLKGNYSFLEDFCIEHNKYHLLSKIHRNSSFLTHLSSSDCKTLMMYALLDKRGDAKELDDLDEGSYLKNSSFVFMQAMHETSKILLQTQQFWWLGYKCRKLEYSLGVLFSFTKFKPAQSSKAILKALKNFDFSFPILLPFQSKYHAMVFAVDRADQLTIYNTGQGLNNHQSVNNKPVTFHTYQGDLNTEKIFWTRVFRSETVTHANDVYNKIRSIVENATSVDIDDSIYCEATQKRGSCTVQCLMAFVQHYFLTLYEDKIYAKGLYKFVKSCLMINLTHVLKDKLDGGLLKLYHFKYQIHVCEQKMYELAQDFSYCQRLFKYYFEHDKFSNDAGFIKIKKRYENSAKTYFCYYYFLIKIVRYLTSNYGALEVYQLPEGLSNPLLKDYSILLMLLPKKVKIK